MVLLPLAAMINILFTFVAISEILRYWNLRFWNEIFSNSSTVFFIHCKITLNNLSMSEGKYYNLFTERKPISKQYGTGISFIRLQNRSHTGSPSGFEVLKEDRGVPSGGRCEPAQEPLRVPQHIIGGGSKRTAHRAPCRLSTRRH